MKLFRRNSESLSITEQSRERRKQKTDPGRWRDLVAYWILGLCNNYGYVVMLSAAHDILGELGDSHSNDNDSNKGDDPTVRVCNTISTGAILLADIIPSVIMKSVAPFIPLWAQPRVAICCLCQAAGFILVGMAETEWVAILGVCFTSVSSGLGEATFLTYSSKFHKNVISTWSSGTGGAGITGSMSYAIFREIGLSPATSLFIMLVVPAIEVVAFWGILRNPDQVIHRAANPESGAQQTNGIDNRAVDGDAEKNEYDQGDDQNNKVAERVIEQPLNDPIDGFKNKMRYMPKMAIYIVPLLTVYLFEYFINQGLFELVNFSNIWLDHSSQYRWLQVDYQIGVFISRSSVNLVQIDAVWIMSVLQFINVIYFTFEVIYFFTPSIWIVFAVVLWEGLLGGGAYVNTFYRISKEEFPSEKTKQFALSITAISDSFGIALAGAIAIPTHNAICALAAPQRL